MVETRKYFIQVVISQMARDPFSHHGAKIGSQSEVSTFVQL
jgi:hypothetical protein